jgi:hypothetical protein
MVVHLGEPDPIAVHKAALRAHKCCPTLMVETGWSEPVCMNNIHDHLVTGTPAHAAAAPRGALLYPRLSREELEGRFLGLMADLDGKPEGDNSMPEK